MGRQINFFLMQKDFDELVAYIRKKGLRIVDQYGNDAEDSFLSTVVQDYFEKKPVAQWELHVINEHSKLQYKIIRGEKWIDGYKSDVIDISIRREHDTRENTVIRGRFYYVKGYWGTVDGEDAWIEKDDEFNKIYNQLRYYIRKNYVIDTDGTWWYMAPHCYEMYERKEDICPWNYSDEEWRQFFKKK